MSVFFPYRLIKTLEINNLKKTVEGLEEQIDSARAFIKAIESGNLTVEFEATASGDETDQALATSLVSMRDQMRKIAREEKQRNWTTEGLARFVDILRSNNDDLKALGDVIISNIIKYMDANQGSLYIVDDGDPSEAYLDMIACYAYNRKKHIGRKISLGEGLVGQCVLEKASVYMTNLPDNYIKITSGLGEALPKNLLIVPLLLNGKVYGVMEMASFHIFETHQREFVEKLAESIASTIANVKVNEQTKKLLHETQVQAEQVRSQEEEMRQNMEELSATQEEMQRILREVEGKEAYLNQLLNVSTDAIFTVDRTYRLVSWNKGFAATLEKFGMKLQKGMNTLDWYPAEERQHQVDIYNRVLRGESFETTASSEQQDGTYWHLSIYAPLRDKNGEIMEAAIFAKDITAMMKAQKETEKLQKEAQLQNEQLKAQEEEMRQNMEELSATQEEMQRVLNEVQAKEAYIHAVLNSSKDAIFTLDKDFTIISSNDGFNAGLKQMGLEITKGFQILNLFPDEKTRAEQQAYYKRAFQGEAFETTSEFNMQGTVSYYTSSFSPLRDPKGQVFAIAVFGKDVTEMMLARLKAENLAKEAQEKTEELKSQEEELRQNMEELASTQEEMQRILQEMEVKNAYTTALLDAADDMIYTITPDYRLVNWNKTFEESVKQYGTEISKGLNTLEWYPEGGQRDSQVQVFKRVFKGETVTTTFSSEINGKTHWFRNSYKPLFNAKGEVYEAVMFTREVTSSAKEGGDTTRSEDHGEKFMIDMMKACRYPIYSVDRQSKLLYFNETFEKKMAGVGEKLALGMDLLTIIKEKKEQQAIQKQLARVFQGESFDHMQEFHHPNHATVYTWMHFNPLKDANGNVIAAGIYSEDITELMTLKKTNALLMKQLENMN